MHRITVIGAGSHSTSNHGPALKAFNRRQPGTIDLAAVCDLDEAKAGAYAEKFGFAKTYTDWREMVDAEKPDGLFVISPIAVTAELVAQVLPTGLPVLIEKPPGENSRQTRRLADLAEKHGTPNMISFNRRFAPAVSKARRWLADHAADRPPQLMIARMLRCGRNDQAFPVGTGIHLIDNVISFMGTPVRAQTNIVGAETGKMLWDARLIFESGSTAAIAICPQVGTTQETYELHGPDYCIEIDLLAGHLEIFEGDKVVESLSRDADQAGWRRGGAYGETEAFVAALQGKGEFRPDLREGLLSMLAAEAVNAGGDVEIHP